MPSKLSLVLIASLAVNAALLGVVGGGLLNKQNRPPPEVQADRTQQSEVGAAWAKLPEGDRAELRKQLHERWEALADDRKRLTEAGKSVHDVAMADPFDEAALRDALTIYQQRQKRMQESAEDILISYFGRMPPDARATAAVGLLTPFNARVQRTEKPDGPQRGQGVLKAPPGGSPAGGPGDGPAKPPAVAPH